MRGAAAPDDPRPRALTPASTREIVRVQRSKARIRKGNSMMHRRLNSFMGALLAAALCASASAAPPLAEQRATYESYAGTPVEEFTWLRHYYSWYYLGRIENQYELAIWTTPFDAYLLKVSRPCETLPFVGAIKLSSTSKTVTRNVDFLLVRGDGGPPWKCYIQEIRPLDTHRLGQDPKVKPPVANGDT